MNDTFYLDEELQYTMSGRTLKYILDQLPKDAKIPLAEISQGQKLPIHNVIKPKGTVCEHTDTYYDDRSLGMVCKKCGCVIPD